MSSEVKLESGSPFYERPHCQRVQEFRNNVTKIEQINYTADVKVISLLESHANMSSDSHLFLKQLILQDRGKGRANGFMLMRGKVCSPRFWFCADVTGNQLGFLSLLEKELHLA